LVCNGLQQVTSRVLETAMAIMFGIEAFYYKTIMTFIYTVIHTQLSTLYSLCINHELKWDTYDASRNKNLEFLQLSKLNSYLSSGIDGKCSLKNSKKLSLYSEFLSFPKTPIDQIWRITVGSELPPRHICSPDFTITDIRCTKAS